MKRVKTNLGAEIIALAAGILIALPVRVYQYLNIIDGKTGFFSTWTNPTVFGLYGLCAVMIVLLLVFSSKGAKKTLYNIPQGRNIPIAVTSFIFAASLLADAVYQLMYVRSIIQGTVTTSKLVLGDNAGPSLKYFLMAQVLFAALSAAYLMIIGLSYVSKKVNYTDKTFLAIFIVLWGVVRMMTRFMQTVSYRYVSELLFELLMIAFSCIFFMAFIRFSAGLLTERVQLKLFGCGGLAIFFSLLCSVPRYIVLLVGRTDVIYRQSSLYSICDLAMPLFIAAVIFGIMGEMQFKEVEEYKGKEEK